jgi:hypothetical protein
MGRIEFISFSVRLLKVFSFVLVSHLSSEAQPAEAWEKIFNGGNLEGWHVIDKPARVIVKDSSMVLQMTAHTQRHAFVRSDKKYKDFIFEADFKRDRTLDSGILFRGVSAPDTAFSALFGYMVKIDPSLTRLWTGGVFVDFGNGFGWLHSLEGDDRARYAEKREGEWNHIRIEALGDHIKVWINGIPTVNMTDDKYREPGYIAFKIHFLTDELEKEKLSIAFKNMRIVTKNVKRYTRSADIPLRDTRGELNVTYFR